jgi:hypothetical protein
MASRRGSRELGPEMPSVVMRLLVNKSGKHLTGISRTEMPAVEPDLVGFGASVRCLKPQSGMEAVRRIRFGHSR